MKYIVEYNDGNTITLGKETSYNDIDRSRLVSFSLFKDDVLVFKLNLDKGQRFIWRKRIIQLLGGSPFEVNLVGWQKTIGKENIQSIAYVFPDGHIELSGAFKGDDILFGKIELIKQEL